MQAEDEQVEMRNMAKHIEQAVMDSRRQ